MSFKDLFSEVSKNYATHRPDYPHSLYDYVISIVPEHNLAWDCGTGNGQAAVMLAEYFTRVIASDASEQQIQAATPKANITYQVMPAENTDIVSQSVDLITIAQALHWFKFNAFYQEVDRVLKPNGIIAAWCYDLLKLDDTKLDELFHELYFNILKNYWAPERKYIDEKYETIPFPFIRIKTPQFFIKRNWNLIELIDYLNTWSAISTYKKIEEHSPLALIMNGLEKAWGNPKQTKFIKWPIYLLAGTKHDQHNLTA